MMVKLTNDFEVVVKNIQGLYKSAKGTAEIRKEPLDKEWYNKQLSYLSEALVSECKFRGIDVNQLYNLGYLIDIEKTFGFTEIYWNKIVKAALEPNPMRESKKTARRLAEDEEFDDEEDIDFTESDAVYVAFPNASPQTIETIADWYTAEGVIGDFSDVEEFAEYIGSDLLDMFWAGDYNEDEFQDVATDLINAGYFEASDFPYEEEDSEE